jgi:hypothetical protein
MADHSAKITNRKTGESQEIPCDSKKEAMDIIDEVKQAGPSNTTVTVRLTSNP